MRGTPIECATKAGRKENTFSGIHSNYLLLLGGPDLQILLKELAEEQFTDKPRNSPPLLLRKNCMWPEEVRHLPGAGRAEVGGAAAPLGGGGAPCI